MSGPAHGGLTAVRRKCLLQLLSELFPVGQDQQSAGRPTSMNHPNIDPFFISTSQLQLMLLFRKRSNVAAKEGGL